jgi:outer membrane protein assembly factor BamE (lipoprotein component of BamABCDE complex)
MKRYLVLIALILSGCVNADPITGKTLPRGGQKFEFATVEQQAEKLKDGMTKITVVMLLGAPAKVSDDGNIWQYLPERAAVLVPARALQLVFKNDVLEKHGYTAIILGETI